MPLLFIVFDSVQFEPGLVIKKHGELDTLIHHRHFDKSANNNSAVLNPNYKVKLWTPIIVTNVKFGARTTRNTLVSAVERSTFASSMISSLSIRRHHRNTAIHYEQYYYHCHSYIYKLYNLNKRYCLQNDTFRFLAQFRVSPSSFMSMYCNLQFYNCFFDIISFSIVPCLQFCLFQHYKCQYYFICVSKQYCNHSLFDQKIVLNQVTSYLLSF